MQSADSIPLTSNPLTAAGLKTKIENRQARIGIIGMGYVGLPLALLFSEQRSSVTGFDVDPKKVDALNAGGSYIVRIPGEEVQAAQRNGFRATSDYSQIERMDVVIICVPTPLNEHHEPDLSYITGTLRAMAPHIRQGQLIILESTTYPGTTEEIVVPLLEQGTPPDCAPRATPIRPAFMSPSLPSARIPATIPSRAAISPKSSAAAAPSRWSLPPPSTRRSSTRPFPYRLRRRRR